MNERVQLRTGGERRATRSPAGWCGDSVAARAFIRDNLGAAYRPPRPRATHSTTGRAHDGLELPCRRHDPELWFADAPADLERAKALCAQCPIRLACLAVAIDRGEYTGVWGGHIFDHGRILARKRPRGRPRTHDRELAVHRARDATMTQEHHVVITAVSRPDQLNQNPSHSAAARLYDAECALHAAHQSRIEAWIDAANQKLHEAVANYLVEAGTRPGRRSRCRDAARRDAE